MKRTGEPQNPSPSFPGGGNGIPEEDALVCLVLLLEGLVRVHPDKASWDVGESLTGKYLEARYRFPRMRFIHLLRRSVEHAENVKTSLGGEACGASFTDDPETMVTVLSADISRAEFAPHVREALVCLIFHVKVLAEHVILSEDTWGLARLNAAKEAPRYGISKNRFKPLLDGAMGTIGQLRESNPFSAIY
jgi:hypothetical protein